MQVKRTPADIVQAQVDAYNARDFDAFASTYGDHAEIFRMPSGKSLVRDKAELISFYTDAFNAEGLVEIVDRIVIGDNVVDHERLLVGNESHEALALYEIREDCIQRVWLFEVLQEKIRPR
ncbi:MAG TPA: nuclear transport factor 2 family protein [Dokdonella sp.]|nr:nuclear transport factor 2 family protein [Dokdonella sp.]